MLKRADAYIKKIMIWRKIYKQINKEIAEQGLEGIEAAMHYQKRVKEEKFKMLGVKLSKEVSTTAGEVLKDGRES